MQRAALMRVLTGAFGVVYVGVRLPYFADLTRLDATDFAPVGVVSVLEAPLPLWATWALALATIAMGIAFVLNRAPRASGLAFFATLLWITTYRSSFGKILHSENLLVLHVGVLALGAWIRDDAWTLRTASVATTLTYFVAGVTKLRVSGLAWLGGGPLGDWLALDAARKIELGSFHSPLGPWLASSPIVLTILALLTLVVEIGAPIALSSPRIARVWCALAWVFHAGILASMAIGFFYPLTGVAFVSLLPVEKVSALWGRRGRTGRAQEP